MAHIIRPAERLGPEAILVSSHTLTQLAVALLGLLVFPPTSAAEDGPEPVWHGFVQTREQFPLTTGFLILEPTSGFVLPVGEWRLDVSMTLSNSFSASKAVENVLDERQRQPFDEAEFRAIAVTDPDEGSFYLDGQVVRTAVRLHRGLGHGLEISVMVPAIDVSGGFTDGVVETFHDLFSLDQEGRKGVPRDEYDLFLLGQGSDVFLAAAPGTQIGDVVLSLKRVLVSVPAARSLALAATVKLPTGDDESLASSGSTDLGLELLGSWCWPTRCMHSSLGYVFAGSSDRLGTDSQGLFSLGAAFEQRLSTAWSITVQGFYWQSYLEDLAFRPLAEESIQLSAALTLRVGESSELSGGFSENSLSFKNSADAVWYVGWRRRFR